MNYVWYYPGYRQLHDDFEGYVYCDEEPAFWKIISEKTIKLILRHRHCYKNECFASLAFWLGADGEGEAR